MLDYNSPQSLKQFLDSHDMAMQKKFGQNFLINEFARRKLVDSLGLQKGDSVWEVGPGLGCMTDQIIKTGANLTVFEIDRGFATALRGFFNKDTNFTLVEGDVLKTWKKHKAEYGLAKYLFGNLPYNIAATIIADTIEDGSQFDKAVFTVQKEVGERMSAKPNSEHYSSFSVLCQWAYEVKPLMDLSAGSFWPQPHVSSRAVIMTKKDMFPVCASPSVFLKVLRASFSSRRKTLKNNLNSLFSADTQDVLQNAGIDPQRRAETLSIEEFIHLSDVAHDFLTSKL